MKNGKTEQILEGARAAFLELGYEGASTDEIVRRARVSKGTLYNYFPDKRALFTAFVEEECRRQARMVFKSSDYDGDIETFLTRAARRLVRLFLSPFMQGIYRLAIAEAPRFPELARAFYDSGPDLGTRRLVEVLSRAVGEGKLVIDDVELAAHQFEQLCKADIFDKSMFQIRHSFEDAQIDRVAEGAVAAFMRAYGTAGRHRCAGAVAPAS